jgi:hypothetical protein
MVAVLLTMLMACSTKDPLEVLLKELEEAAENRDASVFEKKLAASFTGNEGITREESISILRRYFLAYERITVDLSNLERNKTGSRVNFRVTFSGQVNAAFKLQNLLPASAVYQFDLRFVQEEGTLKVQRAFWKQAGGF